MGVASGPGNVSSEVGIYALYTLQSTAVHNSTLPK